MAEIGEWWQKATQGSTRSQFLQDEINFENLIYILFNDKVQVFLIGLNGFKKILNDFSRLIIINEKIFF